MSSEWNQEVCEICFEWKTLRMHHALSMHSPCTMHHAPCTMPVPLPLPVPVPVPVACACACACACFELKTLKICS